MKKLFSINLCLGALAVLLMLLASSVFAASLKVTWNANAETDLAGYKLFYTAPSDAGWTLASGKYSFTGAAWSHNLDVGNVTTYTISNIVAGPYAVTLRAYDTANNISAMADPGTAYYNIESTVGIPPIDVPPGKPVQVIINVQK
jgi:hypothetical protein